MAVPVTELERSRGNIGLRFKQSAGNTRLGDLYQEGCLKVRFPTTLPPSPLEAVVMNVAGGLTDGDELAVTVNWDAGTRGIVTTQAAERIYRCRKAPAHIRTRLTVSNDAIACWLPQESILFDDSHLERETSIELTGNARLFSVESFVFGRTAMGEELEHGHLHDRLVVRHDGKLLFTDALELRSSEESSIRKRLLRPAVLQGARCLATIVFVGESENGLIDRLRDLIDASDAQGGATALGPLSLLRVAAKDSRTLRALILKLFGACLGDESFAEPRVWHC